MNTRWIRATAVALCLVALLVAAAGCNDSDDVFEPPDDDGNNGNNNGGGSSLTSSASIPTDGDGTFSAAGQLTTNNGGSGMDELILSETLGTVGHEIVVTWDTNTHAINGVQHAWGPAAGGPTSGFTQCAPGPDACDPAKVSIDFAGRKVTFASLALADAFGGSSASTLDGTANW
jgi:hypothetical protein